MYIKQKLNKNFYAKLIKKKSLGKRKKSKKISNSNLIPDFELTSKSSSSILNSLSVSPDSISSSLPVGNKQLTEDDIPEDMIKDLTKKQLEQFKKDFNIQTTSKNEKEVIKKELDNKLLTVEECVEILESNFAQDLLVFNLKEKCSIADYLIFSTGSSTRHMKTLATAIIDRMKEKKLHFLNPKIEGENDKDWMLVDAGNIIVQVYSPKGREYFDLDRKWAFQKREDFDPFSLSEEASIYQLK
jgi:ribosome-associated protein